MTHLFLQSQLLQLTGLSQKHKKAFFPSHKVHNAMDFGVRENPKLERNPTLVPCKMPAMHPSVGQNTCKTQGLP